MARALQARIRGIEDDVVRMSNRQKRRFSKRREKRLARLIAKKTRLDAKLLKLEGRLFHDVAHRRADEPPWKGPGEYEPDDWLVEGPPELIGDQPTVGYGLAEETTRARFPSVLDTPQGARLFPEALRKRAKQRRKRAKRLKRRQRQRDQQRPPLPSRLPPLDPVAPVLPVYAPLPLPTPTLDPVPAAPVPTVYLPWPTHTSDPVPVPAAPVERVEPVPAESDDTTRFAHLMREFEREFGEGI